jgi:hypothetical protein
MGCPGVVMVVWLPNVCMVVIGRPGVVTVV